MTWTTPGRWTCPSCAHTFTAYGSADDTAAAVRAVQERHGDEHAAARKLDAKLRRLPERGAA